MQNVDVDLSLDFSKVWGVFRAGILGWDWSVRVRGAFEDTSGGVSQLQLVGCWCFGCFPPFVLRGACVCVQEKQRNVLGETS